MKEEDLAAPRPGNAPLDPTYQGFMQLFGTKTWVKLGGYAKLDAIVDSTKVGNPNMFITTKIPAKERRTTARASTSRCMPSRPA